MKKNLTASAKDEPKETSDICKFELKAELVNGEIKIERNKEGFSDLEIIGILNLQIRSILENFKQNTK